MVSKLVLANLLLLAVPSFAESFYTYDFVTIIQDEFNHTKTLKELYEKVATDPKEKDALISLLRKNNSLNSKPPKATRRWLTLTFKTKPAVSIDFSPMPKGSIKINGKEVTLGSANFFEKALDCYLAKYTWIDWIFPKAYGFQLDANSAGVYKDAWAQYHSSRLSSKINKQEERPHLVQTDLEGWGDYLDGFHPVYAVERIAENCLFRDSSLCTASSNTKMLLRELQYGEQQGVKAFDCKNKELTRFQAVETRSGDPVPDYHLNYDDPKNIKVTVSNFKTSTGGFITCHFVYRPSNDVVTTEEQDCKPSQRKYLGSLSPDGILERAYGCCESGGDCPDKVHRFKVNYQYKTGSGESGSELPAQRKL